MKRKASVTMNDGKPRLHHQIAVQRAEQHCGCEREENREPDRPVQIQARQRDHHAREADHRTDRQVELAGDHQQARADREQAQVGRDLRPVHHALEVEHARSAGGDAEHIRTRARCPRSRRTRVGTALANQRSRGPARRTAPAVGGGCGAPSRSPRRLQNWLIECSERMALPTAAAREREMSGREQPPEEGQAGVSGYWPAYFTTLSRFSFVMNPGPERMLLGPYDRLQPVFARRALNFGLALQDRPDLRRVGGVLLLHVASTATGM